MLVLYIKGVLYTIMVSYFRIFGKDQAQTRSIL